MIYVLMKFVTKYANMQEKHPSKLDEYAFDTKASIEICNLIYPVYLQNRVINFVKFIQESLLKTRFFDYFPLLYS